MNRLTAAASAVMAVLSVPAVTRGHGLWLVTERVRFWIRAAGRSFLRWVTGLVEIFRDPRVNLNYCSFGSKEAI